jgi:hypothetical protein
MNYEQARILSVSQIQDLMNDDLLEYSPECRSLYPIFQTYMDSLVLLLQPHDELFDTLLKIHDPADATDPSESSPSPFQFNIDKVFEQYSKINTYCDLPLEELARTYSMHSQLTSMQKQVNCLIQLYFSPRKQKLSASTSENFLKLIIIAIGEPLHQCWFKKQQSLAKEKADEKRTRQQNLSPTVSKNSKTIQKKKPRKSPAKRKPLAA